MIGAIIQFLWRIANRDKIPKLPRGMLAGHYDAITEDERRVIARMGARDPLGVRVAMKRARAGDVDELVDQLEHYKPRREILRRIDRMITRALYATDYHPHRIDILQTAREARKARAAAEAARRLKATIKAFR
jgi:hypothetical protein